MNVVDGFLPSLCVCVWMCLGGSLLACLTFRALLLRRCLFRSGFVILFLDSFNVQFAFFVLGGLWQCLEDGMDLRGNI